MERTRRAVLGAVCTAGAVALAGCSGDEGGSDAAGTTTGSTVADATATPTADPGTEAEPSPESPTPEATTSATDEETATASRTTQGTSGPGGDRPVCTGGRSGGRQEHLVSCRLRRTYGRTGADG